MNSSINLIPDGLSETSGNSYIFRIFFWLSKWWVFKSNILSQKDFKVSVKSHFHAQTINNIILRTPTLSDRPISCAAFYASFCLESRKTLCNNPFPIDDCIRAQSSGPCCSIDLYAVSHATYMYSVILDSSPEFAAKTAPKYAKRYPDCAPS